MHGLSPFMVAPTAIIRGIGMSFGFKIFNAAETNGYYNSNLQNKALKAIEVLQDESFDFGFIHIKGVDDAGHDKNLMMKVD